MCDGNKDDTDCFHKRESQRKDSVSDVDLSSAEHNDIEARRTTNASGNCGEIDNDMHVTISPVHLHQSNFCDSDNDFSEMETYKESYAPNTELSNNFLPQLNPGSNESDNDSFDENSDFSSSGESYMSETSSCSDSSENTDNEEAKEMPGETPPKLTEREMQSLALAAFVVRHNLTGAATNDLCKLVKSLCPDNEYLKELSNQEVLNLTENTSVKVVHYCHYCGNTFPEDPDIFDCPTDGCNGLRYIGGNRRQTRKSRRPNRAFVMGDIASQLTKLVQRHGMWDSIQKQKEKAKKYAESNYTCLSDIICGEAYQDLNKDGGFLSSNSALSGIFNTDGVQLYSSSSVKLWPIYVAINELPIKERFRRENLILAGLWQGKGQPPYYHYIDKFSNEISILYNDGIDVPLRNAGTKNIKLGIFLTTLDLPAKCKVLNITQYNGKFGCSTCEEPGERARQGKGTTQFYPYHPPTVKPKMRESLDMKFNKAETATPKNRIKGVMGPSGLSSMNWFDLVLGIVPDYMHGVLLGATKTLMYLWFSPTQSKKAYFIGNKLKALSKRLCSIKPPDYIERLPRDLEKHYNHLKAAEYQSWLLYYGIPCLTGFLPDVYLEHFAMLSESIYLLLGDSISEEDLSRAKSLCDKFYQQFPLLYGNAFCGINIHNIGDHLVDYVRQWGPLFCWSAFGFEDVNGHMLKMAHGTGDVTMQLMRMKEIHCTVNTANFESMPEGACRDFIKSISSDRVRPWKILMKLPECHVVGPLTKLSKKLSEEDRRHILEQTGADDLTDVRQMNRIVINQTKYYAKGYLRMKKRICYMVLLHNGQIIEIENFLFNKSANSVYAFARNITLDDNCFPFHSGGHHLMRVCFTGKVTVIPASQIKEKLFFTGSDSVPNYICRMPNLYGHGVIN